MKGLFYLIVIGAAIYAAAVYIPAEIRSGAIAAIGLSDFFGNTIPTYIRSKLSIPENQEKKREKLLGELSTAMAGINKELEAIAPSAESAPTNKTIPVKKVREGMDKTRSLLIESESILGKLRQANSGQGLASVATNRILDKILPATASESADANPVTGKDAAKSAVCIK